MQLGKINEWKTYWGYRLRYRKTLGQVRHSLEHLVEDEMEANPDSSINDWIADHLYLYLSRLAGFVDAVGNSWIGFRYSSMFACVEVATDELLSEKGLPEGSLRDSTARILNELKLETLPLSEARDLIGRLMDCYESYRRPYEPPKPPVGSGGSV